MQANEARSNKPLYWRDSFEELTSLAQIHAMLATIEDKDEG
jgi:hypothetical protein